MSRNCLSYLLQKAVHKNSETQLIKRNGRLDFWEEILNENEVLEDWQLLKWTILKTESQKILL